MNILYINHYAGSLEMGMEFRPFYLAREWKKMGHTVRIIGASYSHLRKVNPVVKEDFEIQNLDGIEYQWIKTRTYQGNGVSRAITMYEFCSKLGRNAKRIAREFKPDVVISSSTYPLDTYPAQKIKKYAKCKLVHEVHDMWPITPMELYGMSKWHPFVMVMQMGENSFCRKADKVVSVLPNASEYLQKHGMKKEHFIYVPNGIELSDWMNPKPLPQEHVSVLNKARSENRMIICFFGSHTRSYSLDYLLDAVKQMDTSKLFLCFVGEGNYKKQLTDKAESLLPSDSYAFLPSIAKNAIPSLLEQIDVSYIGAMKNNMFRFGIGMNKVFDAMLGGKPLLYAVEAPNNFAVTYGCGISVEAENTDALIEGIDQLLNMTEQERLELGSNGKKAVLAHFTYPRLAEKFLKAFE